MSQVLPRLWIGSAEDAFHGGFLERKRITHIINCTKELSSLDPYPYTSTVERYPLEDLDTYEEEPAAEIHMRMAAEKMEEWLRAGHTVLVHCRAGISRSPAVVVAWMILHNGLSYDDAYAVVAKARKHTYPNPYYRKILQGLAAATARAKNLNTGRA